MRTHYLRKWLAALLLPLAAVSANAYDAEIDGICYNFSGDEATVVWSTSYYQEGSPVYEGFVDIPSSVTYNGNSYKVTCIGSSAFYVCSRLISITIPSSVTSIGSSAFDQCGSLTSINIPEGVTSIEYATFQGCESLISITIPSSVTSIGGQAFFGCKSLTDINIPEGVTSIEDNTFYSCVSLTSVTIPSSVTNIGFGAFQHSGLTSITIPSGVTSIGRSAFANCFRLTTVKSYITEPFPILDNSFEGLTSGCKLYVPFGTIEAYKANDWAKVFGSSYIFEMGPDVTVGSTGYATLFYAESDLAIPEGMKAYTGIIKSNWITLSELEGSIPAGTAVVLKCEPGIYTLLTTTNAASSGTNDLKGTTEPLVADGTQYILYEKGGVTAFYQATPGSTIPAGKAYIETDGAGVKGFFFSDDATAIEKTLSNSPLKGENIYNLAGQRLNRMQDGINIVNGKKVLVK